MKYMSSVILMSSIIASCNSGADGSAADSSYDSLSNPFANESALPYHTIPFDKIKDADFGPAFKEAMKLHVEEIEKIANDTTPATFENVFVALEK
ncbi:MAG TPA: dipeptidyl carboxypeptidase II, partial [Niabella sp.]|nr:dipeptidyl carboxypeptidase II [Niabella sp.]